MYAYTLRIKYCLLVNADEHGDDAKIQSYILTNLTIMKAVFNNDFVTKIKRQHIDMYVKLQVYATAYLGLIYKKFHYKFFHSFLFA
jgi:hypothetical protein